ncbi:MAG: LCP family protein, partial [Blautia sp.]|nr:LCP family protein [Blautia sp.]
MGESKHRKRRFAIFAVEILVLALVIGVLYLYTQVSTRLDKLDKKTLNESQIQVNEEVKKSAAAESTDNTAGAGSAEAAEKSDDNSQVKSYSGYKTYALFGIDHRDKNAAFSGENSDTMIVAVVDHAAREIRLASLYRDTLVNVGNDTYSKANAAYAIGGPERAISMLNTNLDLDIHEYVTVDFNALAAAVDAMGGLDIPLSYAEIVHMNNYCVETSEETGKDYTPVELPERPADIEATLGTYHLNGVQATSYCRIRYTASLDMG